MKRYDRKIYRQHLKEIPTSSDPYKLETYLLGVVDIANGFNTAEQSAGILDKNDLLQECYYVLAKTWDKMDWEAIHASDEPQAFIWYYLKATIKIQARDLIHDQKDGVRIPHNKRWEMNETKNVDDFLTMLFPPNWFAENDVELGLYAEDYLVRYDIEQLGFALDDVMRKHLSTKEQMILEHYFGLDRDKLSVKKIANTLGISESNVKKTKFVALKKLKNEEVEDYLKLFYDVR